MLTFQGVVLQVWFYISGRSAQYPQADGIGMMICCPFGAGRAVHLTFG